MERIVLGSQMKKADAYTINVIGIPSLVLMERAAAAVYEEIVKLIDKKEKILVVCGIGNNGADGLAVGRMLCLEGFDAAVCIRGNLENATEEFRTQLKIIKNIGSRTVEEFQPREYTVMIDALFGIGLSRKITGEFYDCISRINSSQALKIAVDIPSGLCSDTGTVLGVGVKADYTVTFGRAKTGLFLNDGIDYAGKVIAKEIGFPSAAYNQIESCYAWEKEDLKLLPVRKENSNKGTYGKVLVIAGTKNMAGAAFLAGKAAYRMGAGLVQLLSVEENRGVLQTLIPEAVLLTYDEEKPDMQKIQEVIEKAEAVVIGPGLGTKEVSKRLLESVLKAEKKTVVDADALNIIAGDPALCGYYHSRVIITPHLGEMSRLMGIGIVQIKENLLKICREYAEKYGITCVLKNAKSVICNGNEVFINLSGNSGMAAGGSGDVLAGIIGGLLAEGVPYEKAGSLGAYIHGLAGDIMAEKMGKTALNAADLLEGLVQISREEKKWMN